MEKASRLKILEADQVIVGGLADGPAVCKEHANEVSSRSGNGQRADLGERLHFAHEGSHQFAYYF